MGAYSTEVPMKIIEGIGEAGWDITYMPEHKYYIKLYNWVYDVPVSGFDTIEEAIQELEYAAYGGDEQGI